MPKFCALSNVNVFAKIASYNEHRLRESVSEKSDEDCVLKCKNGDLQSQAIPRNLVLESVWSVVVVNLDPEELCEI